MQFYTVPNTPLVSQSPSSSSAFDRDPFDSLGTISCESHESTAPLQPQWTQSSPASRAHRATAFDPEPTSTSLPALGPARQQHGDSANPEDEHTDSDLENELNDFGYGARAPRRRKEKKESLLGEPCAAVGHLGTPRLTRYLIRICKTSSTRSLRPGSAVLRAPSNPSSPPPRSNPSPPSRASCANDCAPPPPHLSSRSHTSDRVDPDPSRIRQPD